jgi:hypothetical protein
VTRFPIRLDPIPGESFDGWIDAYAQRLMMPGRDLASALGFPEEGVRLRGSNIAIGDPLLDPERVASRASGIDPVAVHTLWSGLARYDRLIESRVADRPVNRHREVRWFMRVLRPLVGSRWCPSCLNENHGRWLAAWRLPWFLACPTHQTLLASSCPRCGGIQRHCGLRAKYVPRLLTSCSRGTGGSCHQDLTVAVPNPASADLMALQTEIAPILEPTVTDERALALLDRLVDRLILATRLGLDLRTIDRDRRNMQTNLAGPLARAHAVLGDHDGMALRMLATDGPGRQPGALPSVWDRASPQLATVVLQHRDPRLGTTLRLRYRSMTSDARRPEGASIGGRLRNMPLALWPDWSIRLRPPTIAPDTFRIAASIALCIPGSAEPLETISRRWPGARNRQRMVMFGRRLTADSHATAILAALCALADALDRQSAPIDYERRRVLACEIELLDQQHWRAICRADGLSAGLRRRHAHARLWLWETLTGGLPRQAPETLRLSDREFLSEHAQFAFDLPACTTQRLSQHLRVLLDAHGHQQEPITWSPAVDRIPISGLPGPDPDAIDPAAIHEALGSARTPALAAAILGITLEYLHYIARRHPAETQQPTLDVAPPRVKFAATLGIDKLRELTDRGFSLRQIEATYGISRTTLHDELVSHGLPTPSMSRPRPEKRVMAAAR